MFRRHLILLASLTVACTLVIGHRTTAQTNGLPPSAYLFSTPVSSNTPVPDRPGTTFAINNASPAPVIDGNFVVFFENASTAALWSVNTATGQFVRLADTTTAVPGGTGAFNSFNSYQAFNGVVVFSAVGTSDPRGLFSVPVTGGAITKLIDLNTPVPGGTTTFSFDSGSGPYYRVNDGGVLFSASNGVYLVPATGGAVTRLSDATTHPGGGAYNPSFGDESAGLAALTCYDSSVYGRAYLYTAPISGLTSNSSGSATNATFITGAGSPIPDESAGDVFQLGVGNAVRASQGTVVFTANGGGPASGIFDSSIRGIYSSLNGVLSTLVDTGTPVPLGAGTFTVPNSGTLMPDGNALAFRDGEIVFLGQDADGNDGIYSKTIPGGTLTKVFAGGDPAPTGASGSGGATLGSYSVSHGKVAFLFTQEFSSTSMVVATPKPNLTPVAGGDTGTVTITISGKGFVSGAGVTLSAAGKPTLAAVFVMPDATGASLKALFNLTGQADGLYDLTITNADGSVLSYPGSFTIEPGAEPQLYADVIGRDTARGGYFQTYTVLCGNRGDTDAYAVPLVLTVPNYITLAAGNFTLSSAGGTAGNAPATLTTVSSADPDYVRARLLLPVVPAGQYVALTVQLKAPSDPQYADKNFTFSALPLRGLFRPSATGTYSLGVGKGLSFETQAPLPALTPDPFAPIYPPLAASIKLGYVSPTPVTVIYIPIEDDGDDDGGDDGGEGGGGGGGGGGNDPDYPFPPPTSPLPPTGGSRSPQIRVPGDPNDKSGSLGVGAAHYLAAGAPLRYTVEFENEPTAGASARDISITDQLDPTKVNLATFALGPIGFGGTVVTPPPGQNQYAATVDLRPANNLLVQINANLNVSTGLLTYAFTSLDPVTGLPPTDPDAGFLPPDTNPPAGEGFVFYTVAPLAGLTSGTVITNQARVVFDVNAPILTPVWSNTLDVDPPVSAVGVLPGKVKTAFIPLSLSGTDSGGSGIGGYNVYVSDNGGPFVLGLMNVPGPTATFRGMTGRKYAFFSQAEDGVLNLETLKTAAEATTRIKGADLIGAWTGGAKVITTASGRLKVKAPFTVTNQSPATAATVGSVVRFYLSSDGTTGGTAVVLGTDQSFGALAPNAEQAVKIVGKAPVGTSSLTGMYLVGVIDPGGLVKETDKSNNTVVLGPLP